MRPLRGATIEVSGGYLTLRAPADALGVTLGDAVPWRAYVRWRDRSGCAQVPEPAACTQSVPASGVRTLATAAPPRPGFARQHRLRLLATGDSMIQIVDGDLAQRLHGRRGTTVRSDAHIGSGLTKPSELDWLRKARGQASGFKPDVTVVFLGANDGYPLRATGGASAALLWTGVGEGVRGARRADDAQLPARRPLLRLLADAPDPAAGVVRPRLRADQPRDQARCRRASARACGSSTWPASSRPAGGFVSP